MEVLYIHNEDIHNFNAASEVLPFLFQLIKHESLLDVGCGLGTWLKVAKELGVKEIKGIDGSYVDKSLLKIGETEFIEKDLRVPFKLNRSFDIAICLEVAEHLPETSSDALIESLCSHSDVIVFSAAIPNQGGQNHINEQWPEYWLSKFAKYSYDPYDIFRDHFWDNKKIEWWYRQNMFFYAKKGSVSFLDYKCESHLSSYIHPELFLIKERMLSDTQNYWNNKFQNPGIKESITQLGKAIRRKIGY